MHLGTFDHRPRHSMRWIGTGSRREALLFGGLRMLARCHRTRLVHVHFGYAVHDVVDLVRRRRLPLVLSLHGHDATGLPMQRPGYYDEIVGLVDRVVVPSRFLSDRVATLGFADDRIVVAPSGVDLSWFTPQPRPSGPPTLAHVGRLVPKKGLDVLLAAWPVVRAAIPDARLRVVGDGPLGHLLSAGVAGVDWQRPDSSAPRTQVRDVLAAAHVVVTPSRTTPDGDAESLLLVNVEAMATGRPVVSTRHGGIPEVVADDVTGLLVDEGDSDALADAVVRVLSDDALAARLSAAGISAAARFDRHLRARAVDAVYDELVGERVTK
jgi:glycosyltransferase involved in cell wall biosynthesis